MDTLYEAWTECAGKWTKSNLYLNAVSKDKSKRRGTRRWMIWPELVERYGVAGATALVEHKQEDAERAAREIREHPEAPGCKDRAEQSGLV